MPPRFRASQRSRSRAGVAAIEFAIIAPVLLALIVGGIEIGLAVRDSLRVQAAASAGAFYAMQNGFDAAAISTAVVSGSGVTGITATPAPTLFCGCPTASGVTQTTCGVTCPDAQAARQFVQVSASISRTTIIISTFGLPATLTQQSTVRLQ